MSTTPAAKRRRVDAANATLRKPFQSPVIRRPAPAAGGTPGSGANSSKIPGAATSNRSFDEVYSPGSPPVPSQSGALRQTRPASLLKIPKTSPGSARLGSKRKSLGTQAGAVGPDKGKDDDDDDNDNDSPFMALVKVHRTTGQDSMIKDVDRRLETVQQAKKIEGASEGRNPGGPVDQELRDLVVKWKGASRLAADELFETVKERVDSSGGPKAWKAMQQRQMDFYRGFDQGSPAKSKAAGDGDDDEGKEFPQDEVESSLEKEQRLQGEWRAKGDADKDEDEDEPEFNMAMMLRSLNIDLSLLGYDEAEEKWVD